jgi:hypothetical protein
MTQAQLDRAIAGVTGESLRTVHTFGFSLLDRRPRDPEPEALCLVRDRPSRGRPVPYPGRVGDGAPALAECLRRDVYFEPREPEVYAADPAVLATTDRGPIGP